MTYDPRLTDYDDNNNTEPSRTDTNAEVEAERHRADVADVKAALVGWDRNACGQELRDCIEAHIYCPDDSEELLNYSPEIRDVAAALVPLVLRVAEMREDANSATAALIDAKEAGLDYLGVVALFRRVG